MSRESRVAHAKQTAGVVVAYPHADKVDACFHNCLSTLLIHDAKGARRIVAHGDNMALRSGPRIASARNQIARAFLDHPVNPTWLLMIDTDMVFHAEQVDQLLEIADPEESPIVGGLCFTGGASGKIEPTLRIMHRNNGSVRFETLYDYPADTLISIDATGAAFLLVHRRVFKALDELFGETPFPFFAEAAAAGLPLELGEDVTFCLRARGLGLPVKVHTGIKIGHMKPQVIDEQTYREYQRAVAEEGEEAHLARHLARIHGPGIGVLA